MEEQQRSISRSLLIATLASVFTLCLVLSVFANDLFSTRLWKNTELK